LNSSMIRPGDKLQELRSRLGITTREVADQSQQIADEQGDPEFYISNSWLTKLENTDSVPSIQKLISLSAIYRVKFSDLLLLFGLDLELIGKRQLEVPPAQTALVRLEGIHPDKSVMFPVQFAAMSLDVTNLLSRMVEQWGEVPIVAIQHLDLRHNHYGFIGLRDFTLHPLLRPGSFVQIDPRLRKVVSFRWRTEFERPIYFLELRDRYACGWCEVQRTQLTLLPHPQSPCTVRQFEYPAEVEIIGQVTGVATRLVDAEAIGDLKLKRRRY